MSGTATNEHPVRGQRNWPQVATINPAGAPKVTDTTPRPRDGEQ